MIGIIGAMDMEVADITAAMTETEKAEKGMLTFYKGKLSGKDAVVVKCGAGKVNAAICAQRLISDFGVDLIINTGVAGGLDKQLGVCDTVVADKVCQHDMDTTALGEPAGLISGLNMIYMECDKKLVDILVKTAPEGKAFVGTVATGDAFICDEKRAAGIAETFGACACEMEGGAIGHVCCCATIPCAVLRTISDNGENSAQMSFEQFASIAAKRASEHIIRAVELM